MCFFEILKQTIMQHGKLFSVMVSLAITIAVTGTSISYAVYDVPNDDAGCPENCRQIPWKAGSDVWNGGTLPVYPSVNCTVGLTEGNGTTDNTTAITTCLTNAASSTAVKLPPGIYYVNGSIYIPSQKVLRGSGMDNCTQGTTPAPVAGSFGGPSWSLSPSFKGDTGAGAACTTLKLGASGAVYIVQDQNHTSAIRGTALTLSSGYTKGSTSITASAGGHGIVANDWIVIYEQPDTAVPVTATGTYGTCTWCGESNLANRLMSQIVQVTAVNTNTFTLSRPLFYTFKSGLSPGFRKLTWWGQKAGIEDIKIHGFADGGNPLMSATGVLYPWIKNVESYNDRDTAKAFHVFTQYIYGGEFRHNFFHGQRATSSDRAYGIAFFFTTTDNKVEDNIVREQRHVTAQESGGSGNVFLYNYLDDSVYRYGTDWRDGPRWNHGAHPYFTLVEGNAATSGGVDHSWGSSSHGLWFRNWFWGDLSGFYSYPGPPTAFTSTNPSDSFQAVRVDIDNTYYSLLGNVLGRTGLHTTWSAATYHPTTGCANGSRSVPVVYWVGCDDNGGSYNANAWDTMIRHGNYDYKTVGVSEWTGGADHTLKASYYYTTKPSFFGSCAWPPFGPEESPTIKTLPAKERFEGGSTCKGTSSDTTPPMAPVNLMILP